MMRRPYTRRGSTSTVRALLNALDALRENESLHREWIDADVDVSFAASRWRKLVRRLHGEGPPTHRRYVELCAFSYMAEELRVGDLCVSGSDATPTIAITCCHGGNASSSCRTIATSSAWPKPDSDFVRHLRQWLTDASHKLDAELLRKRALRNRPTLRADPAQDRRQGDPGKRDDLSGAAQCPPANAEHAGHPREHRALDAFHAALERLELLAIALPTTTLRE